MASLNRFTKKQIFVSISYTVLILLIVTYLLGYFGVYGDGVKNITLNMLPYISIILRAILALFCYFFAIFIPLRVYTAINKRKTMEKVLLDKIASKKYDEKINRDLKKSEAEKKLLETLRESDNF